ncbi:MAG: FAD/NAD(P)-binding protein [Candidatus Norongarragalinales archaeon]
MSCVVSSVRVEAGGLKTFELKFKSPRDERVFSFSPGQFVEVSVPGFGEAPFSVSSAPHEGLWVTVKAVGNVSRALHSLGVGSEVGLRGPFGKGYPLSAFKGKSVVFVAGGFGMASLRSAIACSVHLKLFDEVFLYYGAHSPSDFLFEDDLRKWSEEGVRVVKSVDVSCVGWTGCVGFVSSALSAKPPSSFASAAFLCGPPKMMDVVAEQLVSRGMKADNVFVSLERLMHCGVGKCGHCMVHGRYVCVDGPVFSFAERKKLSAE